MSRIRKPDFQGALQLEMLTLVTAGQLINIPSVMDTTNVTISRNPQFYDFENLLQMLQNY